MFTLDSLSMFTPGVGSMSFRTMVLVCRWSHRQRVGLCRLDHGGGSAQVGTEYNVERGGHCAGSVQWHRSRLGAFACLAPWWRLGSEESAGYESSHVPQRRRRRGRGRVAGFSRSLDAAAGLLSRSGCSGACVLAALPTHPSHVWLRVQISRPPVQGRGGGFLRRGKQ